MDWWNNYWGWVGTFDYGEYFLMGVLVWVCLYILGAITAAASGDAPPFGWGAMFFGAVCIVGWSVVLPLAVIAIVLALIFALVADDDP